MMKSTPCSYSSRENPTRSPLQLQKSVEKPNVQQPLTEETWSRTRVVSRWAADWGEWKKETSFNAQIKGREVLTVMKCMLGSVKALNLQTEDKRVFIGEEAPLDSTCV